MNDLGLLLAKHANAVMQAAENLQAAEAGHRPSERARKKISSVYDVHLRINSNHVFISTHKGKAGYEAKIEQRAAENEQLKIKLQAMPWD